MSDGKEPVHGREWIAGLLELADFVEWDRFTVSTLDDGRQYVDVYGWIDREDEYKDFVWTRFWPDNEKRILDYTTSSDEYSEELTRIWFGEDAVEDHNECRRVEHAFDVENAIELGEQATLVTDGGTKYSVGSDDRDGRTWTRDKRIVLGSWTSKPFMGHRHRHERVEHRLVVEYTHGVGVDILHEARSDDTDKFADDWQAVETMEVREWGMRHERRENAGWLK